MDPLEWEDLYARAGIELPQWPSQKTMLRATELALMEETKFLLTLTKKQREVWNYMRVFEGQMQYTYYRYAFACGYEMGEAGERGQAIETPPIEMEVLMDYFTSLRIFSREKLYGRQELPQE